MKNIKRIVFLLVIFVSTSGTSYAKVGDYAGKGCDTGPTYCNYTYVLDDKDEMFKRIHNLEVLVDQLQKQNLQSSTQTQSSEPSSDNSRLSSLESRVSMLEKVVDILKNNVMSVLTVITNFLAKLR